MNGISIDGKTKIFGIIGNPVKHSFSPAMHSLAFQESGLNAVYLPFQITPEQLPQLLKAFDITGVQGFNVTLPFKEKIVPYLDLVSDEARQLQAVNTVIKTEHGWKGYSTDGSGFVRSLRAAGIETGNRRVIIVGAGGAAKSIALSLIIAGVSDMTILNRTASKADQLVEMLKTISPGLTVRTTYTPGPGTDILINATSVGMEDDRCPATDDIIAGSGHVIDIIYNPAETPLLKKAAERSIPCMNGIDMLLYQGVEAFEIWTGLKAPVETMRRSLTSSVYSDFISNPQQG